MDSGKKFRDQKGRFSSPDLDLDKLRGGPTGPEITKEGAMALQKATDDFGDQVTMFASVNSRRRGATTVDDGDIRDAYRHLLNPRPRSFFLDVTAEIGLLVSGVLIGYAFTLLIAEEPHYGPGGALMGGGVFIALISAICKHTSFR